MVYALIPALVVAMLGYMLWAAFFRLRRDRVLWERDRSRGKFVFRPRERIRFLLDRSFRLSEDRPEWEEPLVTSLSATSGHDKADEPRAH